MKKGLFLAFGLGMALVLGGCGASSSSTSGTESSDGTKEIATVDDLKVISDYGDWEEYLDMGAYKGIHIEQERLQVYDGDVTERINSILESQASPEKITTGTVKEGDTVNIDYEGKMDGVAFEGGTAQGASLEIGSGSFIPGFEDGLVGVSVGDTVDLNLTFPDPYPNNPDMAGAETVFTVTVNYIEGTETEIPELTDEWVAANSESKTVDEYKEEIRAALEEENQQEMEDSLRQKVTATLVTIGGIKAYPQELIDLYKGQVTANIEAYAQSSGMELEEFLSEYYDMSMEEFEEEALLTAQAAAAQKMVFDTVAKRENLTITQGDLNKKELEIANQCGYASIEDFEADYGTEVREDIMDQITSEMVIDWLIENGTVDYID